MTAAQKTIKHLAIALAIVLIVGIFSGIISIAGVFLGVFDEDNVAKDVTEYQVSDAITALEIDVGAADFSIKTGDCFSVESNLKDLTVEEKNGLLVVKESSKNNVSFENPVLILYVPEDTFLTHVSVTTGAGRLRIETLSAQTLKLVLGAGEVKINKLVVQNAVEIQGGTGSITVSDGSLTDLQVEMGVGELDLTATLYGKNNFELGVGETSITVLRAKELYRVEIEKGIGSVTVDKKNGSGDYKQGDGDDQIQIEGGIGAIELRFSDQMTK